MKTPRLQIPVDSGVRVLLLPGLHRSHSREEGTQGGEAVDSEAAQRLIQSSSHSLCDIPMRVIQNISVASSLLLLSLNLYVPSKFIKNTIYFI